MQTTPIPLAGLTDFNHPHLRALSFAVEEYRSRVARVQKAMAALGLDAMLCHSAVSVCYLTGFESVLWYKYTLAIVPRRGDPILLAQDFEMPNACALVWCDDLVTYPCHGDAIAVTKKLLEERGLANKKLGIEVSTWSLPVPTYTKLKDALSSATLVDATHVLDEIRAVKSPAELAVIRKSAALTSAGTIAALNAVKIGVTDNDVAAAAYQALIAGGSEYMAIDPIVTVGARSSMPHSTHRRMKIAAGDSVLIEVGACVHRYSTASMRTAIAAPEPKLAVEMFEACRSSVRTTTSNIRPGAVGDDIARKSDAVMANFASRFVWHGIYGYSLGIGFPPDWNDSSALIMRGSKLVLEPGMVFHVSTSLRKVGFFGVAFSDTVVVTNKGSEVMTSVPTELRVVN